MTPFTLIRPSRTTILRDRYPDRDYSFKGISPLLGYGPEQESAAQRKTFRYFRDYGMDVTSEGSKFLRPDAFVGLQPMAWVYNPPAPGIPPALYCGTPMHAEAEIRADPRKLLFPSPVRARYLRIT